MRRFLVCSCAVLLMLAVPARAAADITAFIGISPTPENRAVRGVALGLGLLIVGFEFEYANVVEDVDEGLPSLTTGSGNVLVQTPIEVSGFQLYGTIGAGAYRERLLTHRETHFSTNLGGGAKIRLAGPLRLRLDYRIFRLQGSPLHETYHRFYAGANLGF
jgi:opacity protein-like surface antigen